MIELGSKNPSRQLYDARDWAGEYCVLLLQEFDRVDEVIEDGEKFTRKLLWGCQLNHDYLIIRLENDRLGARLNIGSTACGR